MAYCARCRDEFPEGFAECPHCDGPLAAEAPGWVEVFCGDFARAAAARGALEAAGIATAAPDEFMSQYASFWSTEQFFVKIFVERGDRAAARTVLSGLASGSR